MPMPIPSPSHEHRTLVSVDSIRGFPHYSLSLLSSWSIGSVGYLPIYIPMSIYPPTYLAPGRYIHRHREQRPQKTEEERQMVYLTCARYGSYPIPMLAESAADVTYMPVVGLSNPTSGPRPALQPSNRSLASPHQTRLSFLDGDWSELSFLAAVTIRSGFADRHTNKTGRFIPRSAAVDIHWGNRSPGL